MSKRDSTLTQERLKQLLHYDPETGIFTRLIDRTRWKGGKVTKAQINNKSGFLGVYLDKRSHKWIAKVTIGKKTVHYESLDTPEAAHEAYKTAKRKLHEGCTI